MRVPIQYCSVQFDSTVFEVLISHLMMMIGCCFLLIVMTSAQRWCVMSDLMMMHDARCRKRCSSSSAHQSTALSHYK